MTAAIANTTVATTPAAPADDTLIIVPEKRTLLEVRVIKSTKLTLEQDVPQQSSCILLASTEEMM